MEGWPGKLYISLDWMGAIYETQKKYDIFIGLISGHLGVGFCP
jgi:hypothetical protein